MQSKAATVAEYLASLPADRRTALLEVRDVILHNLDAGYEEGMSYGMIGYHVPHRLFPAGYHCDPSQGLPFAGLAAQKNYLSIHLMGLYPGTDDAAWFHKAWARTGKKLDMGKACIRFQKADDLALDVLGEAIRRMPAKRYIEIYTAARALQAEGRSRPQSTTRPTRPASAGKVTAKKAGKGRPAAK